MQSVIASVEKIACEMADCSVACAGITNAPLVGRPPRGLVIETHGRLGLGALVVGLNPGKAGRPEVQYYRSNGAGYEQQLAVWSALIRDRVPYFLLLRKLLGYLELSGPILWTDVAKCEGAAPPIATLMTCSQRYLAREFTAVPREWPIIAAGAVAFQASGFMAGLRPVIGFSHPTGKFSAKRFRAQLDRLANDPEYLAAIQGQVRTESARVWLS